MKTRPFSTMQTCGRIGTITFKNGGHCVRALLRHQGRLHVGPYVVQ